MSSSAIFAPKKPGGAIPMTVNGWLLRSYVAPTTDGSDPYFPCQAWKLITATGGAPSRSSASVNRRPRHVEMPKVSKKLPETYSPLAVATGAAAEPARRTPECAGDDGCRCETGRLAQHAEAESHVSHKSFEPRAHPGRANSLSYLFNTAELESCSPSRLLRCHSLGDVLLCICLNVVADFVV